MKGLSVKDFMVGASSHHVNFIENIGDASGDASGDSNESCKVDKDGFDKDGFNKDGFDKFGLYKYGPDMYRDYKKDIAQDVISEMVIDKY